jgi:lysyl-tRNA synthetase, class II
MSIVQGHGRSAPVRRGWAPLTRVWAWYVDHAPRLTAFIALLLGLATLAEALLPRQRDQVHDMVPVVPVPASATAAAVVALTGLLLLYLARGLRRRKRRAWQAAVLLSALRSAAFLIHDEPRPADAAITLVLLLLLLAAATRFNAKPDPRTRWYALIVFVQFSAVAICYGLALLYFSHRVEGSPSWSARSEEVMYALIGANGPVQLRGHHFDEVFHFTMLGFALTTMIVVAYLALRPFEPVASLTPDDETRLRGVLGAHGERDSLGYFALRRDKAVVWSPTGKAAITYRVVQGVALASGDPIGDPEAWPGAMAAYRRLTDEYAWTPAVIGCSEQGATVYRRELGLSALELGDEAIVEVDEFSLDGRAMRGVRQACTRISRAGYTVQIRRIEELDPAEISTVAAAAAAWRGDAAERGFSMALSRLADPADPDCMIATAHQDGQLRGLLHFVPWGPDGLSLDLMRRDHAADNGLNEYMIAKVIGACPALGVTRVSLNFAMFRDALERGEKIGAGPASRAWRALLIFLSRFWQIESLYRFNVKFRPYWEPRCISYPAARDLPRIALAALEAEAFFTQPRVVKRLLGRA